MDLIAEIKSKLRFDDLFRELYPHHYHENGNSRCPFHHDTNPSFQVDKDHGYCHAGCRPENRSKNFGIVDLWMQAKSVDFKTAVDALAQRCGVAVGKEPKKPGRIVAEYIYQDANGNPYHKATRDENKKFKLLRWDADNNDWVYGLKKTQPVLYRLPGVLKAQQVWVAEGEKDADTLSALGLCGTTSPMGAGKWHKVCVDGRPPESLRDKLVIICPDNDKTGRDHAQDVARSLHGFAATVKILDLPGLPEKGDVSDFIQAHGEDAKPKLLEIAEHSAEYDPSAEITEFDTGADLTDTGNTQRPAGPSLTEAQNAVRNLLSKPAKERRSAAFEPANIGALALVEDKDPALFLELKDAAQGYWQRLSKQIKKSRLRVARPGDEQAPATIAGMLGTLGIPVPQGIDGLVLPDGYVFDKDGTGELQFTDDGPKRIGITHTYILIKKKLRDPTSGVESLQLLYFSPQGWKTITASRGVAVNSRLCTDLAKWGFPIGSHNAKAVARYLYDFEAGNEHTLPIQKVTSANGWSHADLPTHTVYANLNNDENQIVKITPQGIEIILNGDNENGILLATSDKMAPLHYLTDVTEQRGGALVQRYLIDQLACNPTDGNMIFLWLASGPLDDYASNRPIIRIEGGTDSGKTAGTELFSTLMYGDSFQKITTVAALYRDARRNPLQCLDNLETNKASKDILEYLLISATRASKEKSAGGSDGATAVERPRSLNLTNGIEPIGAHLTEILNRTFTVEFSLEGLPDGFISSQAIENLKQHRNEIWSWIFQTLSLVLRMIESGALSTAKTLFDQHLGNHSKRRCNDYLSLMYLFAIAHGTPQEISQNLNSLDPNFCGWIETQHDTATTTGAGGNPIATLLKTLFKKWEMTARPENDEKKAQFRDKYLLDLESGQIRKELASTILTALKAIAKEFNLPMPYENAVSLGKRLSSDRKAIADAGFHVEKIPGGKNKVFYTIGLRS